MRRGFKDAKLFSEGNVVYAIGLGWDFCAEHQWGTPRLCEILNIEKSDLLGLPSCTMRKGSNEFMFVENKKYSFLRIDDEWNLSFAPITSKDLSSKVTKAEYPFDRRSLFLKKSDQDYVGGWSQRDAAVLAKANTPAALFLPELAEAIAFGDAATCFGEDINPYSNSGLILAIASKVPTKIKEDMYNVDVEAMKLITDVKETGIEEKLKSAGKEWFSLTPKRPTDHQQQNTDYPVMFWLNPKEKETTNEGSFSVESLELWIKGEGPVLKTE